MFHIPAYDPVGIAIMGFGVSKWRLCRSFLVSPGTDREKPLGGLSYSDGCFRESI